MINPPHIHIYNCGPRTIYPDSIYCHWLCEHLRARHNLNPHPPLHHALVAECTGFGLNHPPPIATRLATAFDRVTRRSGKVVFTERPVRCDPCLMLSVYIISLYPPRRREPTNTDQTDQGENT